MGRLSDPLDLAMKKWFRLEMLEKLNQIPGVDLAEDAVDRRPWIPLSTFADSAALNQLLAVFEWVIEQIKNT